MSERLEGIQEKSAGLSNLVCNRSIVISYIMNLAHGVTSIIHLAGML